MYRPGDSFAVQFRTVDRTSGDLTDASSLPVAVIRRNGVDQVDVVTVVNDSTGLYTLTGTINAAWVKGDDVQLRVTATVAGKTGVDFLHLGQLDSKLVGDLSDPTAVQIRQEMDNNSADLNTIIAGIATVLSTGGSGPWTTATGFATLAQGTAIKAATDQLVFVGGHLQAALVASGVDAIEIEDGINMRQSQSLILASQTGKVTGSNTSGSAQTITIYAGGDPTITRIVAACDGLGNRTTVTLTPPS